MVPLLRAEGGEEEPEVCLVATDNGGSTEAEAKVLPLPPDEGLVVDVSRGPGGGTIIEQTHGVLMEAAYGVGLRCRLSRRGRQC